MTDDEKDYLQTTGRWPLDEPKPRFPRDWRPHNFIFYFFAFACGIGAGTAIGLGIHWFDRIFRCIP